MSFDQSEVPMGLGMALMQNPDAMQYFSSLTQEEQQRIIAQTHSIESKTEMKDFVNSWLGEKQ